MLAPAYFSNWPPPKFITFWTRKAPLQPTIDFFCWHPLWNGSWPVLSQNWSFPTVHIAKQANNPKKELNRSNFWGAQGQQTNDLLRTHERYQSDILAWPQVFAARVHEGEHLFLYSNGLAGYAFPRAARLAGTVKFSNPHNFFSQ